MKFVFSSFYPLKKLLHQLHSSNWLYFFQLRNWCSQVCALWISCYVLANIDCIQVCQKLICVFFKLFPLFEGLPLWVVLAVWKTYQRFCMKSEGNKKETDDNDENDSKSDTPEKTELLEKLPNLPATNVWLIKYWMNCCN